MDAHSEECFYDKAEAGTKLGKFGKITWVIYFSLNTIYVYLIGLIFEIVEGGWMDIDIKITGPDGKTIYHGEGESTGKYTFAAYEGGIYHYCFSNKMSSLTPKVYI